MLGLNKEDIEFLKELQHELLTQDHVSQASPRFWVVRGTAREYGMDSGYSDGCELINTDSDTVASSMEEACKYLIEVNEDGFEFEYEESNDSIYYLDNEGQEFALDDFDDVLTFLNDDRYSVVYYINADKNFENTMFLTNKECKAHIRANYYHYPDDAHSYAVTAWRAPEVSKVWEILEKINCDELERIRKG